LSNSFCRFPGSSTMGRRPRERIPDSSAVGRKLSKENKVSIRYRSCSSASSSAAWMSAASVPPIPRGASSASHWMLSVRKRGNIHQRITFTPAAFMAAMSAEKASRSAATPGKPQAEIPPKSPHQRFQAQLTPYMKRRSQP
jgi:hypothetical protein